MTLLNGSLRGSLVLWFVIMVVLLPVSSTYGEADGNNSPSLATEALVNKKNADEHTFPPAITGLDMIETSLTSDEASSTVTAKLQNNTSHNYAMIIVEVQFISSNNALEKATANVWDVKAHSTATFKARSLLGVCKDYFLHVQSVVTNMPVTPDTLYSPEYEDHRKQAIKKFPAVMARLKRNFDGHHKSYGNFLLIWPYQNDEKLYQLQVPAPVDRFGKRVNVTSGKGLQEVRAATLLFAEILCRVRRDIGFPKTEAHNIWVSFVVVGSPFGPSGLQIALVRPGDLPRDMASETKSNALRRRTHFITSSGFN